MVFADFWYRLQHTIYTRVRISLEKDVNLRYNFENTFLLLFAIYSIFIGDRDRNIWHRISRISTMSRRLKSLDIRTTSIDLDEIAVNRDSGILGISKTVGTSFSDLYRFSPTGLMPPHPGLSPHAHALASHALVSSAPKTDHSTLDHNHRFVLVDISATPAPFPRNRTTQPRSITPFTLFPIPPTLVVSWT